MMGYKQDIAHIKNVFGHKLNYKVKTMLTNKKTGEEHSFINMNRKTFNTNIRALQKYLRQEDVKVKRFIVFFLSHGSTEGLCFINKGEKEPDTEIDSEDIPKFFYHNHVPALKGVPKAFFFQNCRGSCQVAAGGGYTSPGRALDCELATGGGGGCTSDTRVYDSDIYRCWATLDCTKSYADEYGSWYVQRLLHHIKTRFEEETLTQILDRVALDFVNGIDVQEEDENGNITETKYHQFSTYRSTATKNYFLGPFSC